MASTFGRSQNIPPKITATGNQSYCPTAQINVVTSFDITDPDDTQIDAFFIQISTGYTFGEDKLLLTGNHPKILSSWDPVQGKLTLFGVANAPMDYPDLIAAVSDVIFESTINTDAGEKLFSFTIGNANFLPSTGHYYEYVPALGITWTAARAAADTRTYFGLQGYLATVTSPEEARITGEQVAGAGWIGGSDAETESVWKWVTGPEAGRIFWNGQINGTTPNYANWNTGEPNQFGDEDYAHITAPGVGIDGSWNDLSNTGEISGDYQPKGYVVEYGGMPGDPIIDISASTKINIPTITNTVVSSAVCGSGSFTLEATASEGDVLWFDSITATTPIFTGAVFSTPTISGTNTYYALASVGGCLAGRRTGVTATVTPIPTIDNVVEDDICLGESGVLRVAVSAGTVNWYDVPTGGTPIATGLSYTTPPLVNTTTYYVDATRNGCTKATRTPITITVQYTGPPSGNPAQEFCDVDNATLADLVVSGTDVKWYAASSGGTFLDLSTQIQTNTTYFASQTLAGCESSSRLPVDVFVYQTVIPPNDITPLEVCDSMSDGDKANGISEFDLTTLEPILLNGSNAINFDFKYFTDASRTIPIGTPPETFMNTVANEQTIYVRIENISNADCYTDTSFTVKVNALPLLQPSVVYKNCDEDGSPDGFTDFNLNGLDDIITSETSNNFNITYHSTSNDADMGVNPLNPVPYNNLTSSVIYGRVENDLTGCFDVSEITLEVSTTALNPSFIQEIAICDDDADPDGRHEFDLTTISNAFINQFPTGQNLTVHYFKNLNDAQLEENEILTPENYVNEIAFSEILYVRVESEDNGACFGIGPNLVLTVHPRPEFEVDQSETFCLNGGSVELSTFNPNGSYSYEWTDSNNTIISNSEFAMVSAEDIYTVVATSDKGCKSFPVSFEVKASGASTINRDDITIEDLSNNNTIVIDDSDIGIGDYEFALDNEFGPFQDQPVFRNVIAGEHMVYVRDKNDCGTVGVKVFVMGFPKFLTPNGDGDNDTWNIKGLSDEYIQNSKVFIYDRYGKLIKQIQPTVNGGWNGTFNGQLLATNDYWFVVYLVDQAGETQVFRGHFSLIR